ncbi:MAG: hypothetical protein WDW38_009847 [Sanguina aurantia]
MPKLITIVYTLTTASSSQGSASTYNFYRQSITSPNATLYCGLFSISYETWCKYGAVDAYITDETTDCNENVQANCPRMGLYSSMSCTGYTCERRWRYSSWLTSVCLVLAVEDPQVPAVCDLQITGQRVSGLYTEIAHALGVPLWKAVIIAMCGGVALIVLLVLLAFCIMTGGCLGCFSCCASCCTSQTQRVLPLSPGQQEMGVQALAAKGALTPPGFPGPPSYNPGGQDPRLNTPQLQIPAYRPSSMTPPQPALQMTGPPGIAPSMDPSQQQQQQQLGRWNPPPPPPPGYGPASPYPQSGALLPPAQGASLQPWHPYLPPPNGQRPGQPVLPLPADYRPLAPTVQMSPIPPTPTPLPAVLSSPSPAASSPQPATPHQQLRADPERPPGWPVTGASSPASSADPQMTAQVAARSMVPTHVIQPPVVWPAANLQPVPAPPQSPPPPAPALTVQLTPSPPSPAQATVSPQLPVLQPVAGPQRQQQLPPPLPLQH